MEYHFIDEMDTSCTELQNNYKGEQIVDIPENLAFRAYFKFLFELCHVYHYFKVSFLIIFTLLFRKRRFMPALKWCKLPSRYSAR